MTTRHRITHDPEMSTSVQIFKGYSPRRGDAGPRETVLRIDASIATQRARFPHAAEIVLTIERATAIRDALDEYIADEVEKARPKFAAGDRVEVYGYSDIWDGPATVRSIHPDMAHSVWVDSDGVMNGGAGAFLPEHVRPYVDPTPDYAALAATFNPGDLALVSSSPGTRPEPGSGFVSDTYAGKAVNVVEDYSGNAETVCVQLYGHWPQIVHVAHLTRAVPVPA